MQNTSPILPEQARTSPTDLPSRMSRIVGALRDRTQQIAVVALMGLANAVSSSAMAQSAPKTEASVTALAPNPEYDQIIAEAEKAEKDVLEHIDELRKGNKITFTQGREVRQYYAQKAAIEQDQRIAGKKEAVIEQKGKLEVLRGSNVSKIQEYINASIQLVSIIEQNKAKNIQPTQRDVRSLRDIYGDKDIPEDLKKRIRQNFPEIIDSQLLAQG